MLKKEVWERKILADLPSVEVYQKVSFFTSIRDYAVTITIPHSCCWIATREMTGNLFIYITSEAAGKIQNGIIHLQIMLERNRVGTPFLHHYTPVAK